MARTVWLKNKSTGVAWEVEVDSELHERLRTYSDDQGLVYAPCDAPNTGNRIPDGKGGLLDLDKLKPADLRGLAVKKAEGVPFLSIPEDAKPEDLIAFIKS